MFLLLSCRSTENGELAQTLAKGKEISTCREGGSALLTMGYAHAHVPSMADTCTELARGL